MGQDNANKQSAQKKNPQQKPEVAPSRKDQNSGKGGMSPKRDSDKSAKK